MDALSKRARTLLNDRKVREAVHTVVQSNGPKEIVVKPGPTGSRSRERDAFASDALVSTVTVRSLTP